MLSWIERYRTDVAGLVFADMLRFELVLCFGVGQSPLAGEICSLL